MNAIALAIKQFINALYPNKCAGCGRVIPENEGFCDFCFEMLPKIDLDKFCTRCGSAKSDCRCKHRTFRFEGAVAAYYNEGPARKAMYQFKFRRTGYFADFFAKKMTIAVKNAFYDAKIDAVAYVPLSVRNRLKRGYDQSRELASRVAENLGLPLLGNAIGCHKKKKPQHETEWKERFSNVRDMYFSNMSLKGRTILLVDDIKTSGATLDECAKVLLTAGADRVYCVTGLAVKQKNKRKK